MDPTTATAAATAAATASSVLATYSGQIVLVLVSLISTLAMLWKTSRDQKYAMEMIKLQHDMDAADRREKAALEKAERIEVAAKLQTQVVTEASNVQNQLHAAANSLRDRTDALAMKTDIHKIEVREDTQRIANDQTNVLTQAIEQSKNYVADKADAAYHEANGVNEKLKALSQANLKQGELLQKLFEIVQQQQLSFQKQAPQLDKEQKP